MNNIELITVYIPIIAGAIAMICFIKPFGIRGRLIGILVPLTIFALAIRFRSKGIPIEMMKGALIGGFISIMFKVAALAKNADKE